MCRGNACKLFARFRLAAPPGDPRAKGPSATAAEQERLANFTKKSEQQVRDDLTNYRNRKGGYVKDLSDAIEALSRPEDASTRLPADSDCGHDHDHEHSHDEANQT